MKKTILTILAAGMIFLSQAQFKANMGTGYSFGHSPTVEVGIGYSWALFNVTGGFQVHATEKVNSGAVFELKIGHDVPLGNDWSVNPQFGYGYHYASSDLKNLNVGHTLFGVELSKMFREDIGIYGSYSNIGKLSIVSMGIKGFF